MAALYQGGPRDGKKYAGGAPRMIGCVTEAKAAGYKNKGLYKRETAPDGTVLLVWHDLGQPWDEEK